MLRPPELSDGAPIWHLARQTVDVNGPYGYLMLAEYFTDTCAVAVRHDDLLGFVTGFRVPDRPDTLFVWQIAVAEHARGLGIGSRLLEHVVARPAAPAVRFLEATVTPDNDASAALFRAFAHRRGVACDEEPLFERSHFPASAHEPEVRFRIGPW